MIPHLGVNVKKVPSAELHPLAVVEGDGSLLAVFGEYEAGLSAFKKLPVKILLVEAGAL